jgi:hypothetical protein
MLEADPQVRVSLGEEGADAAEEGSDPVGQERVRDDDRRDDDAQHDRILGHRLSLLGAAAGTKPVEPTMETHHPGHRRCRCIPVCLFLGIRPE